MDKNSRQIHLHKKLSKIYHKRFDKIHSEIWHDHFNQKLLNLINKNIKNGTNSKILDFGCGNGVFLKELSKTYKDSEGIDISPDMLNLCDKELKTTIADGCNLPFDKNTFDCVISRGSLHHMSSLEKAFLEIKRVLKPGGILVLSEPADDFLIIKYLRYCLYKLSSHFDDDDIIFNRKKLFSLIKYSDLKLNWLGYFGFLAYAFCGFPDKINFFKFIPFKKKLTYFLIKIDNRLEKLPYIKNNLFHIQAVIEK